MTRKRHIQPHRSHPSLKNKADAEKTKRGQQRPEGATFTRSKATAWGREDGGDDKGRRGQPLQDRKPLPGAEKTEGTT